MQEIEERNAWLADMEALGQGNAFRAQIKQEIAVRIARMEKLNKPAVHGRR
jgi:hypothetical protein